MIFSFFENIIFNNKCILCNSPFVFKHQNLFCEECISNIEKKHIVYCHSCGKKTSYCIECQKEKKFDDIRIFTTYSGNLRKLILYYKFQFYKNLSSTIASIIKEDFLSFIYNREISTIFPIPSSKKIEKQRGFNHLYEILKYLLPEKIISNNLVKIKDTHLQVEVSAEERARNLKSSFYLKSPYIFENKNILIFDDIITTGATLMEVFYTVRKVSPKNIYAYIIAT